MKLKKKIEFGYTVVIGTMILSGLLSIICLTVLYGRFMGYVDEAQSSEAAKESTVLIESSVKAVEKGMVIADETAQQLENVVSGSKEITVEVNGIAEALKDQVAAIGQVEDGVSHINDVVQTNSATSQECAAASQEMSNQAEHLEDLISKFQVA